MGTTYCYELHTKAQAVAYLTDEQRLRPYALLDKATVGNHLWLLVEHNETKERIIALELLSYSRADNCWGHKSLDESMGPNACDCPLRFLDLVPEPPSNYDWRGRVHAYHEHDKVMREQRKRMTEGATITLYGDTYILGRNLGRRGWNATRADGADFRIKANQMKDATL